jgi:signal transduction histidine kinase
MKLPFHLRQPRSIAVRLIGAVLAVELVAALVAIALSLGYEHHIHFRTFDIMLRGRADSVLGAVQDADDNHDNVMLNRTDLALPANDIWEVYDDRGRLLGRSASWPDQVKGMLASPSALLAALPDGQIQNLHLYGHHYRFLLRQGSRIIDPGLPGGGRLHRITILYGIPTGHVWSAIREAVKFYAAASLILLLATGPLIAWLLQRGLAPLRQLATLAARISVDDWQFAPPAEARETPELAPLTLALESALERLHHSFDQQSVFVSDAAHEFKTAVAVVKSSLQLLTLVERSPAAYRTGIERALSDVERLEQLIARSLTLARIERAPAPEGPAPSASLADAVQATAAELASVAELRQVAVQVAVAADANLAAALSDADARLLVSNLLLNAIEHSPAGAGVQIALTRPGESLELTVEDHGEGIAPEALPHVFDRFYRGDPSRARSTGGAGLGLSIVKALVTRAGGTIRMESRLAAGTTVMVRLPVAPDAERKTTV